MTDRDDLLRRVSRVNPAPPGEPLPADVADSRPPLTWLIERNPFMPDATRPTTARKRAPLIAAAAVTMALIVAVPMLLTRSEEDDAATTTPVSSTSALTTVTAVTTTTMSGPAIVPVADITFEPFGMPRIAAISVDEAWVASPTGIGHWVSGRWDYYGFLPEYASREGLCQGCVNGIRDIAVGSDGAVWAATDLGVFSFDGAVWIRRLDSPTRAVAVDGDGTVWIGGLDRSEAEIWLAYEDAGTWLRVDDGGLPAMDGSSLHIAALSNGEIWVNTFGYWGQAVRYDGTSFDDVTFPDRTGLTQLTAFARAPGGEVWATGFTTSANGEQAMGTVARRDGDVWTTLELPDDLSLDLPGLPWDIAFDSQGTLWVLGLPGLASFDGTRWDIEAADAIAMDLLDNGTIVYLDTTGGVHTIDPA